VALPPNGANASACWAALFTPLLGLRRHRAIRLQDSKAFGGPSKRQKRRKTCREFKQIGFFMSNLQQIILS